MISFLTGDLRATVVISVMVVLGVVLRFFQEMRADSAAEKLQAMVSTTATVLRGGKDEDLAHELVPGDVVRLSAGDMVPADVRLLSAKDLFINQAALTGESMPVEKNAAPAPRTSKPARTAQRLLPGLQRGERHRDGGGRPHRGADLLRLDGRQPCGQREIETSFDKGINSFTWLMIRFIAVMVPAGVPHQRAEQRQLAGSLPVRAGRGGRPHPRDAAR